VNLQRRGAKSPQIASSFRRFSRLRGSIFDPAGVERRSWTIRGACNTVRVEPGSDPTIHVTLEPERPLGAAQSGYADLGPISPELALVDQLLAEQARTLLPEPRERPRPARRPASGPHTEARLVRGSEAGQAPARRRRSRWPRTALLVVLVFAAGAFSGGFLGEDRLALQRVLLEVEAGGPTATAGGGGGARPYTDQTSTGGSRSLRSSSASKRIPRAAANTTRRKPRQPAPVTTWAANVLGVTANVDGADVRLGWQRPSDSDHVVVLRASSAQRKGVVVFRTPGTSYRDSSARACTEYRYTIVNYDRHGHSSTGIPTSVVTRGCT